MTKLYVTILAGGDGKRMGSELPKVLCPVKGEAMVVRLIKQVLKLNPDKIIIVVGKFHQMIREEIEKHVQDERIIYVIQQTPLGTGHAVKCTLSEFSGEVDNIILNGDVPMIQSETVLQIYQKYLEEKVKLMITSISLAEPKGNGRIVKDALGLFQEIVEEKDCTPEQRQIKLVNCGIYIVKSSILQKYITMIGCSNAQNEYYLTDLVKLYDGPVGLYELPAEKEMEIYNVNTKEQLEFVEKSPHF